MVTRFKANISSGDLANPEDFVNSYQVIYRFKGFVGYNILKAKLQVDTRLW